MSNKKHNYRDNRNMLNEKLYWLADHGPKNDSLARALVSLETQPVKPQPQQAPPQAKPQPQQAKPVKPQPQPKRSGFPVTPFADALAAGDSEAPANPPSSGNAYLIHRALRLLDQAHDAIRYKRVWTPVIGEQEFREFLGCPEAMAITREVVQIYKHRRFGTRHTPKAPAKRQEEAPTTHFQKLPELDLAKQGTPEFMHSLRTLLRVRNRLLLNRPPQVGNILYMGASLEGIVEILRPWYTQQWAKRDTATA